MIWIGRLVTIPLGLVLLVLLLLTLVLLRVDDTFLKPDFYTEQLAEADVYEFALNDLLTSALNEARGLPGSDFSLDENPILTSGLSTERIVQAINRAAPPEYFQDLVEQSFDQFGGYVTAERDEFDLNIRAGEQVAVMMDEIKALLREADAYGLLFDQVVEPEVRDAVRVELPLGAKVSPDRLVEAVRRIVPPEWVQQLVEDTLDEATSYMIGDSDTFEIGIRLSDRVDIALDEMKSILREVDAAELLYTQVVEPTVLDSIGEQVDLGFGVPVTNSEVLGALRQVAPPAWVQEQAERLIDETGPYLAGRTDSFSVDISLVDNKRRARGIIADLVDTKLAALIDDLPACRTVAEALAATRGGSGVLPACVPPNVPIAELIKASGIDIGDTVQRLVLGPLPDKVTFSDARVRSALRGAGAEANIELLDQVRAFLREGCVYTQLDLARPRPQGDVCPSLYDPDISNAVENVRSFLSDGFTYTQVDFREDLDRESALAQPREEFFFVPESPIEVLDLSRTWLGWARANRWVFYVPLIMLLVIIGFLGGRGWSGRVVWAAWFLFITAGILVVAAGPVYETLASSQFGEMRVRAVEEMDNQVDQNFRATSRLALNKGLDTVESVADEFVSGIRDSAVVLAVIAIIAIALAMFWDAIIAAVTSVRGDLRRKNDGPP